MFLLSGVLNSGIVHNYEVKHNKEKECTDFDIEFIGCKTSDQHRILMRVVGEFAERSPESTVNISYI